MMVLSFLLFFLGMSVLFRKNAHLMSIFIGIEMAGLGVIFLSTFSLSHNVWLIFLIVCLGICEASLCLALLVMVMRLCGNDLVKNLSLM
uniref:NADH-ubiquinone oxidoreductase chain 4L n=1 Tax=Gregariella coralliophaga TaxID=2590089 RepID=A0A516EZH6_9BIVA|nr:NADH dehydrogenase subunit 4L [Gregariella coralliophaga]QDO71902.1 NADH dehydrogenase subunit 4L [Gregariella coralliophaga]